MRTAGKTVLLSVLLTVSTALARAEEQRDWSLPNITPLTGDTAEISFNGNGVMIFGGIILLVFVILLIIWMLNRPWESTSSQQDNSNLEEPFLTPLAVKPKVSTSRLPDDLPMPEDVPEQTPEISQRPVIPMHGHFSFLIFKSGADRGLKLSLDDFPSGRCTFGRSDLPENSVKLRDDTKVSRMCHAEISRDSQGFYHIENKQGLNGVWVNTKLIDRKTCLRIGDTIRIGDTELQYSEEMP